MPTLACDLILKGGVTSGVVYPPAVLELSKTFQFRSIGGASAGAIAAALTAAAEYGRQSALRTKAAVSNSGFEGFRRLDEAIGEPGFMQQRFIARGPYRPILGAVFRLSAWSRRLHQGRLAKSSALARALSRVAAFSFVLIRSVPMASLVGALIGAAIVSSLAAAAASVFAPSRWIALLVGVALGSVGGGLVSLVSRLRGLRTSGFGLCSGSAGPGANFDHPAALELTDWLHYWINGLAGRRADEPPLTIRDLKQDHGIALKLMSANLNLSQAFVLPLERGSRSFFFRQDDLRPLFPPPVFDYLCRWAEANPPTRLRLPDDSEYLRLPLGEDLPVIVATRLSLSFPFLLSAVRIHSFDDDAYASSEGAPIDPARHVEEHWMSDGGITSNFPVHLFDTWVPERPTFGITLYDSPVPGTFHQRERAHGSVLLPRPEHFQHARPPRFAISGTLDFMRAVFQTAQSHRDVAQSGLPSYRERVVQIFLEPHEGGLNLSMSPETIAGIKDKGRQAANELLARYVADGHLSSGFQEHVWVRLLVLLSQLEKQFAILCNQGAAGWREALEAQLFALFQAQLQARPRWYRHQDDEWTHRARARVAALIELIASWNNDRGDVFSDNPPRPEGRLRVTSET